MMGPTDHDDARQFAAGGALDPEITPPPAAHARIISELRSRGLLRSMGRRGIWRAAALLGAAAALFTAGLVAGRREAAPAAAALPRFVLFLSALPGESAAGEPDRVREYKGWAARVRGEGRLIGGEKLRAGGLLLAPGGNGAAAAGGPAAEEVSGFFVIEARDLDAAIAVARSCPHLRHGGRITVRAIDPV